MCLGNDSIADSRFSGQGASVVTVRLEDRTIECRGPSSSERLLSAVTAFRRLFEPLVIGNFTVRNRIVNTTHGSGLGDARDLRYLQERARGGAGLLGVHTSVGIYNYAIGAGRRTAVPDWDELALSPVSAEGVAHYDEVVVPWLRARAEVVHAEGAACFAQVYHPGAGRHLPAAGPSVAPSAVADPYEADVPHPLRESEIEELAWVFADGIRRAREGGMDAAEIHAAHGYLVNEFLSPYFNRRTDRWGATREDRVRFPLTIIEAARTMVGPDFPIGIRVGVDGDGNQPRIDRRRADRGVSAALTTRGLRECERRQLRRIR